MKYLMRLKYDGDKFNGFATQPHKNTVEDKLNATLSKIFNQTIKITGSARTDSKVHAYDQVIMFESKNNIAPDKLKIAFNCMIDNAIYCFLIKQINADFHVRHDMVSKTYRYTITKEYDPFMRRYAYYERREINLDLFKLNCDMLIGTHDFTSFCARNSSVTNMVRTINFINVFNNDNTIVFEINGDGFLYNMVRIIVGTLIEISVRGLEITISDIIKMKDRNKALKTAPAQGLVLYESIY